MDTIKSVGVCCYCNKQYTKSGMSRHLQSHLGKMDAIEGQLSYLLKVEVCKKYEYYPYFLYLQVSSRTNMGNIDDYLRDIWLECCGHMSSFRETTPYRGFLNSYPEDIDLSLSCSKVFEPKQKLEYTYDFGSSTCLDITVIAEYPFQTKERIKLLSRNEPLQILCDACDKNPASWVCIAHGWEEDSLFCEKCAKKHEKECEDFEDYSARPVVNSPRFGVCGYEGGLIDIERDGVYKMK